MKWDMIKRRLEGRLELNKKEIISSKAKLKRNPQRKEAQLRLGKCYKQQERLEKAIRYVKHDRHSYPISRVERLFNISLR